MEGLGCGHGVSGGVGDFADVMRDDLWFGYWRWGYPMELKRGVKECYIPQRKEVFDNSYGPSLIMYESSINYNSG